MAATTVTICCYSVCLLTFVETLKRCNTGLAGKTFATTTYLKSSSIKQEHLLYTHFSFENYKTRGGGTINEVRVPWLHIPSWSFSTQDRRVAWSTHSNFRSRNRHLPCLFLRIQWTVKVKSSWLFSLWGVVVPWPLLSSVSQTSLSTPMISLSFTKW